MGEKNKGKKVPNLLCASCWKLWRVLRKNIFRRLSNDLKTSFAAKGKVRPIFDPSRWVNWLCQCPLIVLTNLIISKKNLVNFTTNKMYFFLFGRPILFIYVYTKSNDSKIQENHQCVVQRFVVLYKILFLKYQNVGLVLTLYTPKNHFWQQCRLWNRFLKDIY